MSKDINRLKVVLAEKKRTNKWLAEQLGKRSCNRLKVVYQHHTAECRDISRDCQIFEC